MVLPLLIIIYKAQLARFELSRDWELRLINPIKGTHAPLYCATSSPKTNTLSFCSSSSASASLSASLTVYSFVPLGVAYCRLLKGCREAIRPLEFAERVDDRIRDVGRSNRETTMAAGALSVRNWRGIKRHLRY